MCWLPLFSQFGRLGWIRTDMALLNATQTVRFCVCSFTFWLFWETMCWISPPLRIQPKWATRVNMRKTNSKQNELRICKRCSVLFAYFWPILAYRSSEWKVWKRTEAALTVRWRPPCLWSLCWRPLQGVQAIAKKRTKYTKSYKNTYFKRHIKCTGYLCLANSLCWVGFGKVDKNLYFKTNIKCTDLCPACHEPMKYNV